MIGFNHTSSPGNHRGSRSRTISNPGGPIFDEAGSPVSAREKVMAAPAESALILALGVAAAGLSYVVLGGANRGAMIVRAQSGKPLPGMEKCAEPLKPGKPALTEQQSLLRLIESPESCCFGGPN